MKPPSRANSQGKAWLAVFFLAALAFLSAVRAPFVFDDLPSITHNASIRQLSPVAVPLSPPPNTSVTGRPVVNFSFAVNYALNDALGVDHRGPSGTVGYHVVNVAIHVACALLLFALIRRTARGFETGVEPAFVAGVATLLWMLHPIQTEAVDYVVQRSELLVSALYLATLYASVRAWDARASARVWWYVAGVATCALAMASKEVAVSLPLVVVLYDRAFRASSWRAVFTNPSRRWFYGALAAATLIITVTVSLNARRESAGFGLGISWYEYFYTQAWAITRYLRLLAWPAGLTFDYGEKPITGLGGVPGLVLLTSAALATVYAWTKPRWVWLGFLGACFFLLLAPSSSVVPIKTEIAAERRIYLASASVIVALAVLLDSWRARGRVSTRSIAIGVGAIAMVLAALTFARGTTYTRTERLYRDVIAKAPQNPRGYVGVGLAMFEDPVDRSREAAEMFRQAIAVDSTYFAAWQVLGTLEAAHENWPEAHRLFGRALRLQPQNDDAAAGLARAYLAMRQPDSAMRFIDRVNASDVDALWMLSTQLIAQGRGAEAIPYLERVRATAPAAFTLATLSVAYAQAQRADDAVNTAMAATLVAGDTASVYLVAGRAMLVAKRYKEARGFLREAVTLDPTSEAARKALETAEAFR